MKASLLVRAAELKREKPQEDESAKRAREEQEILQNITVRALADGAVASRVLRTSARLGFR